MSKQASLNSARITAYGAQPSSPLLCTEVDPAADRYIRDEECGRLSGLSRTTRWRLEARGKFPKRRQLSENAVGWLLSEVLAWRASRPVA